MENPAGSTGKIKHINNNIVATVLNVTVKTQTQSVNKGQVIYDILAKGCPWAPPMH